MPVINKKASHLERPSGCVIARGFGLPRPYVKQLKALTGCFNCFENLTIENEHSASRSLPKAARAQHPVPTCGVVQPAAELIE